MIRGVYDTAQVNDWNAEILRYIDDNRYLERAKEKVGIDKYFSTLASGAPQIFGLYCRARR